MPTEKEMLQDFARELAQDIRRVERQREEEADKALEFYKPLTNQEWAERIGLDHQDTFRKHRHALRRPDDKAIPLYAEHFQNERYYDIFGRVSPSLQQFQKRFNEFKRNHKAEADAFLNEMKSTLEKKDETRASVPKKTQRELVTA